MERHNVVVTREFDAPIERVWRAWTESEDVRRWWGPSGFTAPLARMDVREGGTSLVCMRAPAEYGGQEYFNTWTYGAIERPARLAFVSRSADRDGATLDRDQVGIPAGVPREVPHVITLAALGDDRTVLTVTEYGYGSAEARDLSRAGLEQCLDKMATVVVG